jgi:hypothetical protein
MLELALIATGIIAAIAMPRRDTAEEYRPWTEADFEYVLKRELPGIKKSLTGRGANTFL